MASRENKDFEITEYLTSNNNKLLECFNTLKMTRIFNPMNYGKTLLIPPDNYIKEIKTALKGDCGKAIELLQRLVIKTFINDINDFKNNLHAKNYCDERVEMSGDKILLNKTKYTILKVPLDTEFSNVSIYELKIDNSKKLATKKKSTTKKGAKSGGGEKHKFENLMKFVHEQHGNGEDPGVYKVINGFILKTISESTDTELKDSVKKAVSASHRGTFYCIVSPYGSNLFNIKLPYDLIDSLKKFNKTTYEQWKNDADSIYSRAKKTLFDTIQDRGIVSNTQRELLKKTGSLKEIVFNAYKDNYGDEEFEKYLARDLFSVFCYTSSICENESNSYYKTEFINQVQGAYSNINNVLSDCNDIAHIYSTYGVLCQSDAFLYEGSQSKQNDNEYKNLNGSTPIPVQRDILFTIEYDTVLMKGGSCDPVIDGILGGLLNK